MNKKTLFNLNDVLELLGLYSLCFGTNLFLDGIQKVKINSILLQDLLDDVIKYQVVLSLSMTLVVVVFHYRFLLMKRQEIYLKLLVGDTGKKIRQRYLANCFGILGSAVILVSMIGFSLSLNVYPIAGLTLLFSAYILISSLGEMWYEGF